VLLKNKHGFTLVETIIALAIFIIVIGATSSLILSSMNLYANTATQDEARSLGNYAYNYYFDRLSCAKDIEFVSDNKGYPKAIAVTNGKLQYRKLAGEAFDNVFTDDFYHGCTLSVNTWVTGYILNLSVTVSLKDKELYSKKSAFKLINPAAGKGLLNGTMTAVENPTVYYQD